MVKKKKSIIRITYTALLFIIFLTSCSPKTYNYPADSYRTYYEVFLRSFYDSNNDGIGDINGLIGKLDYIGGSKGGNNSLGCSGIWLMPIMPSPSYHKYDVTDYYNIDPIYGTMEDFNRLIKESKEKNISLIIDLVLNHTSIMHPWFQSAAKSIGIPPCGNEVCSVKELCREHNPYCGYYNFSSESKKNYVKTPLYSDWYYECAFDKNMPDLNLDNPALRKDITDIMKFWLDKGVSGFRLDATTHYYDQNTSKNVEFLSWLNKEAKKYNPEVYIVGEAWTSNNVVLDMYESKIQSFFNFDFAKNDGLFVSAARSGMGTGVAEKLADQQKEADSKNEAAIDALFLSNHDQARSAGTLSNNESFMKIAAALYILAPGNSFIYYGEEIGTLGSGKDENKRLAMLWSNSNKTGIPHNPPNADYSKKPEFGVEEQLKDKSSLLRHYMKLVSIKNNYPAIARGVITPIESKEEIVAFSVLYKEEKLGIFHNVSDKEIIVEIPEGYSKVKLLESVASEGKKVAFKNKTVKMPPYSSAILDLKNEN